MILKIKMSKFPKICLNKYKLVIASIFSFILGCMVTINMASIERTCKLDNTDREYNIMNNSKLKNPDLIILIVSAPKNLDRRNAIRETWLKLKERVKDNGDENVKFKMKHYFVIGSLSLTPDDILHLSTEQSMHNDILILPMYDSYKNLSLKVLKSFLYLRDQTDIGLDFKYVLKCDDDSFIRIDNLAHEIAHLELMYLKSNLIESNLLHDNTSPYIRANLQTNDIKNATKLHLYWGYFQGSAKIKTTGKWKENNWIFCDNYLPYALGGGYILSKGLVMYLGRNVDNLRYYNSEDVSVGTWLAPVNNVLRIHDTRFDTEWASRGCQNHYLISHNLSVNRMKQMYENIISKGNLCETETTKRQHWLYNWTVPPSKCCKVN